MNDASSMKPAVLLILGALSLAAQRKPGSQLDHLPSNIEVLTHFGERADISPDNRRVAFMTKSFGDAMVIGHRAAWGIRFSYETTLRLRGKRAAVPML